MMGVGQSYRDNDVPRTYVELWNNQTGNVKLLDSHFATLFQLRFILTVFLILKFISSTRTTGFKLDFSTEYPFGIELIIQGQYETRYRNRIPMFVRVTFRRTIETVNTIILKTCYHFSVSTETEFLVVVAIIRYFLLFLFVC